MVATNKEATEPRVPLCYVEVITSKVLRSPPRLGWPLWIICVTYDHGYVPLVVYTSRSSPRSWLITGFVTRLTRHVSLVTAKYLIVDSFDYDILETPRVIRSRTSKDRQFNDQIKRDEKTSNDLHTTIHKTKDRFNYVYVCYNKSWVFEFYLKM